MSNIPYRVGRLLGKGGMADVYEAETVDGRRVALKVFRSEKGSRFLKERFMAEAKLLKRLYHPNIVRVHDCGVDKATGRAWFAMDLVLDADGNAMTLENVRRRGAVADENALRDALDRGIISGAACDVLTVEPMREDDPLRGAENLTLTPHIAWASYEARVRLISLVASNLRAYQNGLPVNQVK